MERSTVVVVCVGLLQVVMQSNASESLESSCSSGWSQEAPAKSRAHIIIDQWALHLRQTEAKFKKLWRSYLFLQTDCHQQKVTLWELKDTTYRQDKEISRLRAQLEIRDQLLDDQNKKIQKLSESNLRSPSFP